MSRRRLLPLSIHTRLTLWYAGAMLVILVLIAGGLGLVARALRSVESEPDR